MMKVVNAKSVSPGVTAGAALTGEGDINSHDPTELVATLSEEAFALGTFGVGAVMLDSASGEVLAVARNAVIQDGKVADPTAHAERQLVDWYYEQVQSGNALPRPQDITIVSSLDPCMMCAGACLEGGFHVATIGLDKVAGVNHTGDRKFEGLPSNLRIKALQALSYLAIDSVREFSGSVNSPFRGEVIDPKIEERTKAAFWQSLKTVQQQINEEEPGEYLDPSELPDDHKVKQLLREYDSQAVTVKSDYEAPDSAILDRMVQVAKEAYASGHTANAVSLIGPHGNVLMTMAGKEAESPIRTAMMETVRAYTTIRAALDEEDKHYLPHPKQLKFVSLKGPGKDATSVMDLGAYGSTIEGPVPESNVKPLQFIMPQQLSKELDRMMENFPPLYRDIIQI